MTDDPLTVCCKHLANSQTILNAKDAEIALLKDAIRRLAEQDAMLSLLCKRDGSQVVTVTMDATLTDEEREAIASCIADDDAATAYKRADILRGLLERTK